MKVQPTLSPRPPYTSTKKNDLVFLYFFWISGLYIFPVGDITPYGNQ
jgi:hypothetical protein